MPEAVTTIPMLGAPTASGKSAAALELAESFDLEIVGADAMQVYRGMDIGTAKASAEERARVPHHLIDVVDPDQPFSVAAFVARAEVAIAEVLARGRLPLVIGGTGYYLRSLSEGLPSAPAADERVQAALWHRFEREGLDSLLAQLTAASPEDARRAQRNPRRVVRALEVLERSGKPPSSFPRQTPAFHFSKVLLLPSPADLTPRIEARVTTMFEAGLVAEVEKLLTDFPSQLTATQAIGYKEVVQHLRGETTLQEAHAAVVTATVKYAKRQRTWFRREGGEVKRYEGVAGGVMGELREWIRRRSGIGGGGGGGDGGGD